MKKSASQKVLAPVKHGSKNNVPTSNTLSQPKNPYTKDSGYGLKNTSR
jgi:hypothetical protein